eukprot:g18287.t1
MVPALTRTLKIGMSFPASVDPAGLASDADFEIVIRATYAAYLGEAIGNTSAVGADAVSDVSIKVLSVNGTELAGSTSFLVIRQTRSFSGSEAEGVAGIFDCAAIQDVLEKSLVENGFSVDDYGVAGETYAEYLEDFDEDDLLKNFNATDVVRNLSVEVVQTEDGPDEDSIAAAVRLNGTFDLVSASDVDEIVAQAEAAWAESPDEVDPDELASDADFEIVMRDTYAAYLGDAIGNSSAISADAVSDVSIKVLSVNGTEVGGIASIFDCADIQDALEKSLEENGFSSDDYGVAGVASITTTTTSTTTAPLVNMFLTRSLNLALVVPESLGLDFTALEDNDDFVLAAKETYVAFLLAEFTAAGETDVPDLSAEDVEEVSFAVENSASVGSAVHVQLKVTATVELPAVIAQTALSVWPPLPTIFQCEGIEDLFAEKLADNSLGDIAVVNRGFLRRVILAELSMPRTLFEQDILSDEPPFATAAKETYAGYLQDFAEDDLLENLNATDVVRNFSVEVVQTEDGPDEDSIAAAVRLNGTFDLVSASDVSEIVAQAEAAWAETPDEGTCEQLQQIFSQRLIGNDLASISVNKDALSLWPPVQNGTQCAAIESVLDASLSAHGIGGDALAVTGVVSVTTSTTTTTTMAPKVTRSLTVGMTLPATVDPEELAADDNFQAAMRDTFAAYLGLALGNSSAVSADDVGDLLVKVLTVNGTEVGGSDTTSTTLLLQRASSGGGGPTTAQFEITATIYLPSHLPLQDVLAAWPPVASIFDCVAIQDVLEQSLAANGFPVAAEYEVAGVTSVTTTTTTSTTTTSTTSTTTTSTTATSATSPASGPTTSTTSTSTTSTSTTSTSTTSTSTTAPEAEEPFARSFIVAALLTATDGDFQNASAVAEASNFTLAVRETFAGYAQSQLANADGGQDANGAAQQATVDPSDVVDLQVEVLPGGGSSEARFRVSATINFVSNELLQSAHAAWPEISSVFGYADIEAWLHDRLWANGLGEVLKVAAVLPPDATVPSTTTSAPPEEEEEEDGILRRAVNLEIVLPEQVKAEDVEASMSLLGVMQEAYARFLGSQLLVAVARASGNYLTQLGEAAGLNVSENGTNASTLNATTTTSPSSAVAPTMNATDGLAEFLDLVPPEVVHTIRVHVFPDSVLTATVQKPGKTSAANVTSTPNKTAPQISAVNVTTFLHANKTGANQTSVVNVIFGASGNETNQTQTSDSANETVLAGKQMELEVAASIQLDGVLSAGGNITRSALQVLYPDNATLVEELLVALGGNVTMQEILTTWPMALESAPVLNTSSSAPGVVGGETNSTPAVVMKGLLERALHSAYGDLAAELLVAKNDSTASNTSNHTALDNATTFFVGVVSVRSATTTTTTAPPVLSRSVHMYLRVQVLVDEAGAAVQGANQTTPAPLNPFVLSEIKSVVTEENAAFVESVKSGYASFLESGLRDSGALNASESADFDASNVEDVELQLVSRHFFIFLHNHDDNAEWILFHNHDDNAEWILFHNHDGNAEWSFFYNDDDNAEWSFFHNDDDNGEWGFFHNYDNDAEWGFFHNLDDNAEWGFFHNYDNDAECWIVFHNLDDNAGWSVFHNDDDNAEWILFHNHDGNAEWILFHNHDDNVEFVVLHNINDDNAEPIPSGPE